MTNPTEGDNNTGCGALRMTRKARPHDGGNREMLGSRIVLFADVAEELQSQRIGRLSARAMLHN